MKNLLYALLFLMCTLLFSCSSESAGTAIEDGNSVAGVIKIDSVTPAESLEVRLVPVGFIPINDLEKVLLPDSLIDTTDSQGRFEFTDLDKGVYKLVSIDDEKELGTQSEEKITVDSTSKTTVSMPYLERTGSLKVFSNFDFMYESNVYIAGTEHSVYVDSSTLFIKDIPAGVYDSLMIQVFGDFYDDIKLHGSFEIKPGEEFYIGP